MQSNTADSLSTSSVNISADVRLSFRQKLRWLYECRRNNQLPLLDIDPRIQLINFQTRFPEEKIPRENWGDPPVSPARFLCDSFWAAFDLSPLCMKGPVRALEVGCGTGLYGLKLKQKLGEALALYRGVDIVEHGIWRDLKPSDHFEFFVEKGENIGQYLSNINFIFTQSAIEHFEHDLVFFGHLKEHVKRTREAVWQVHLMPSAECLRTYLWHGYRQYTPRTISKITRLFSEAAQISIYRLGGARANRVHKHYITWPSLLFGSELRQKMRARYVKDAVAAIQDDQSRSSRTDASFYALVIKSHSEPH